VTPLFSVLWLLSKFQGLKKYLYVAVMPPAICRGKILDDVDSDG
jgi:hypothetical protein